MSDIKTTLISKLKERPDLMAETFAFAPDKIREYAEAGAMEAVMSRITVAESVKYHDRFNYLTKTRIAPGATLPRCGRKVVYTKVMASERINDIKRSGRGEMRSYECPACGGWHLTHKQKIKP